MLKKIETAAKLVRSVAATLKKELERDYAIEEESFDLKVETRFNKYDMQCTDKITGFASQYGDDFNKVLSGLKKQLTLKSELKAAKRKQIERLQKELEDDCSGNHAESSYNAGRRLG